MKGLVTAGAFRAGDPRTKEAGSKGNQVIQQRWKVLRMRKEQEKDLGAVSATEVDALPCSVHAPELTHDEKTKAINSALRLLWDLCVPMNMAADCSLMNPCKRPTCRCSQPFQMLPWKDAVRSMIAWTESGSPTEADAARAIAPTPELPTDETSSTESGMSNERLCGHCDLPASAHHVFQGAPVSGESDG